jgi:uncharacterized membrane protein required for colicin V production
MPIIDVVLVCIVLVSAVLGFAFGFLHTLGSLIGALAGIFLGSRISEGAADKFGFLGTGGGQVTMFIIIFLVVSRLVGIVFWFAQKAWGVLAWIPLAGAADRILGLVIGIFEGIMIAGIIVFYAVQVLPEEALRFSLEHSFFAQLLLNSVSVLQLLLPEHLRVALGT